MASRCQSISKPAFSLMRSSLVKGMRRPTSPISPTTLLPRPSHSFSRLRSEMGSLQTLLPLYSAVSSARLTSCLGMDSRSSRSLSQELGLCVPR
ncbi:hypothetical protein CKAN_01142400 [Cinnamomum micranthum f. kanehirae]|uniref:Protein NUCLEAR FUSION DEFECTIVE 6, chloroplastic/mitochondrial n=1 Tax=Cinnamomum micranthum f. kanehirae TaxID=337451 RepID=A0A3S3MMK7_9MAGN|nr:hypothetical protein CKAN_01142400 [Cinnamomum micranthum f. kanehirae]